MQKLIALICLLFVSSAFAVTYTDAPVFYIKSVSSKGAVKYTATTIKMFNCVGIASYVCHAKWGLMYDISHNNCDKVFIPDVTNLNEVQYFSGMQLVNENFICPQ